MAYVDKLKIDNNSYDIKDTEGRAETAKKIDKDTVGNLNQTVSGNMNQTVSGDFDIHAKSFAVTLNNAAGDRAAIKVSGNSNTPVEIGSDGGTYLKGLTKTNQIIKKYNDNFDWWPLEDYNGKVHKVALIGEDADFTTIPSSPVDIRAYQDLKMDGTDDITATINTHTKNEPLFIPAGTYKVSAPLQLKHSLYGAGSSRDPRRGTSDTILKYTGNPTAFGSQGVITVSGDDVTGNIVVAHLDIICNGMIGGVVFTTDVYTDNSLYDVSIYGVKSYGVYLQPNNSTLNRYCYMDNVMVWGFSDNTPVERWTGSVAFFWGNKAPDCECNNLVNMVCQVGFDCRTDVYGCNWASYHGIPSGGTGGTNANTWWNNTIACKVTNNDIHVTNFYADTCRYGFVFDGSGKAAAYINNMIYTCDDGTATTETGYASIALIGSSPNPQFIVNGGIINRSAKVSTTIQSTGTYPVTNAVCKLDDVYIYTKHEYIYGSGAEKRGQYICEAGEHRCIDLAITNQMQYIVKGQNVVGNPSQYRAFAIIPVHSGNSAPTQGSIRIRDNDDIDITIYLSINNYQANDFICAVNNRTLYKELAGLTTDGAKNITYRLSKTGDGRVFYAKDEHAITLYCYRPASYDYVVTCEGFNDGISPVMLDRIRNVDGTPMDYPRWDNNDGMTGINTLVPSIS